jgi:hypothetical protein
MAAVDVVPDTSRSMTAEVRQILADLCRVDAGDVGDFF